MPIPAVVEDIESIPEPIREHYTRDGEEGPFRLAVEPAGGLELEDVGALKRSLANAKQERRALAERMEKLGEVPEDVQDRLARLTELEQIDPEKDAALLADQKIKAREKQLVNKHNEERTRLAQQVESLGSQLGKLLVEDQAIRAIVEAKGSPELLLPHVTAMTRVREEGGSFVVEVLDTDGVTPRVGDSQGGNMTIPQLIQEMRANPKFGRAFDGSDANGSGASSGSTRSGIGGAGPKHRGDFVSSSAKAAWIGEHGVDKFKQLPSAPGG